jgi:hypothetical protein
LAKGEANRCSVEGDSAFHFLAGWSSLEQVQIRLTQRRNDATKILKIIILDKQQTAAFIALRCVVASLRETALDYVSLVIGKVLSGG